MRLIKSPFGFFKPFMTLGGVYLARVGVAGRGFEDRPNMSSEFLMHVNQELTDGQKSPGKQGVCVCELTEISQLLSRTPVTRTFNVYVTVVLEACEEVRPEDGERSGVEDAVNDSPLELLSPLWPVGPHGSAWLRMAPHGSAWLRMALSKSPKDWSLATMSGYAGPRYPASFHPTSREGRFSVAGS